jgi:hypothetical protein
MKTALLDWTDAVHPGPGCLRRRAGGRPRRGGDEPTAETATARSNSMTELSVYNWEDYIDEQVLRDYEERYGVTIIYDTYASNEDLLTKLQAGAAGYDVIFPSDYMVAQMIELGLAGRDRRGGHAQLRQHRRGVQRPALRPRQPLLHPLSVGHDRHRLSQRPPGLRRSAQQLGLPVRPDAAGAVRARRHQRAERPARANRRRAVLPGPRAQHDRPRRAGGGPRPHPGRQAVLEDVQQRGLLQHADGQRRDRPVPRLERRRGAGVLGHL